MRAVVSAALALVVRSSDIVPLPAGLDLLREMIQSAIRVEQTTIRPYMSAMYSLHEGENVNASAVIHSVISH